MPYAGLSMRGRRNINFKKRGVDKTIAHAFEFNRIIQLMMLSKIIDRLNILI